MINISVLALSLSIQQRVLDVNCLQGVLNTHTHTHTHAQCTCDTPADNRLEIAAPPG